MSKVVQKINTNVNYYIVFDKIFSSNALFIYYDIGTPSYSNTSEYEVSFSSCYNVMDYLNSQ